MDREERQRIYRLLHQYYPQAKQLKSAETLTAWGLILADYTYEDVKNSVLRYAAQNKFFPDVSDITAGLSPVKRDADKAPYEALQGRVWEAWQERIERKEQQEAATGGPCKVRSLWGADRDAGEPMLEGLFLRRHYPEDCAGCRRMQVGGGCTQRIITERIDHERAGCRILLAHAGEAHQSAVLKRYWREMCPTCPNASCFWPVGMSMTEEVDH